MHLPKFLTLIATLTEEEAHDFLKYVKKTHTKGKVAHKLLADILKFVNDGNGNWVLDIDYAQKKTFGKKDAAVPKKKIQNTLSEITQWLEEFLLIQKALSDSFERQALWLSVLQERKPGQLFPKTIDQVENTLVTSEKNSVNTFMKRMFLGYIRYFGQDFSKINEDDSALRTYESQLDQFYIVAKLKVLCERLNRANVLGTKAPIAENEDLAKHYVNTSPLVALYLDAYQLLRQQDDESYQKAESSLKKHYKNIAPADVTRVIDYLQNYAATRTRGKQNIYWGKIHELDVLCVDNKWLEHHEGITITKFINMATAACKVGAIDWARQFIEKQNHILPPELRSLGITLASATISFDQGDYPGALELITPLSRKIKEIPVAQEKTRAMLLFIQASYELNDPQGELIEYCTSCENNLRNTHKSNLKAAGSMMDFIGIVKSLLRRKDSQETIIEQINNKTSLMLREWLLKKAGEYKA